MTLMNPTNPTWEGLDTRIQMELFHLSKFQKQVQLFIPLEVSLLVIFGKEQGVVMGWVMLGASDNGLLLALSGDNTSMLTLLRFIELCMYDLRAFLYVVFSFPNKGASEQKL